MVALDEVMSVSGRGSWGYTAAIVLGYTDLVVVICAGFPIVVTFHAPGMVEDIVVHLEGLQPRMRVRALEHRVPGYARCL